MDAAKTIEFLLSQQVRADGALAKIEAGLAKTLTDLDKTDAILRRAVSVAVCEARSDRNKRRERNEEFDRKMTQLSAAQLVTGQSLNRLIQSLQRGAGLRGS